MASRNPKIRLPPLMVDGEPKILHEMTLRELQSCFQVALKAALEVDNQTLHAVFEKDSPAWWPISLPWNNTFWDHLPMLEKPTFVRHLLQTCYSFHKQEDTLHLFDVRDGEAPHWEIRSELDGQYTLYNKETNAVIWRFTNGYQLLPLIALSAKQEQKRCIATTPKKRRSTIDSPRTRKTCAMVGESPVSIDLPAATAGRQRTFSILGSFSPRHSVDSDTNDMSRAVSLEAYEAHLACPKCNETFLDKFEFAVHLTKSCHIIKRDKAGKNAYMLGLNLIPKQVQAFVEKQIRSRPPLRTLFRHSMPAQLLSRLELSSELGAMLHQNKLDKTEQRRIIRQIEHRCVVRDGERAKKLRFPFPNVYRPIRYLRNYMIDYSFTAGDRRAALQRKKALKKRVKRLCKNCSVKVSRLTPKEIRAWKDPKLRYMKCHLSPELYRRITDGSQRLQVILPKLTSEKIKSGIDSVTANILSSSKDSGPADPPTSSSRNSEVSVDWKMLRALGLIPNKLEPVKEEPETPAGNIESALSRIAADVELESPLSLSVIGQDPLKTADLHTVVLPRLARVNTREQRKLRTVVCFASTVFKCHICGIEELFQKDAWANIELHVALRHTDVNPIYIPRRQVFPTYQILIVEAFQNTDNS